MSGLVISMVSSMFTGSVVVAIAVARKLENTIREYEDGSQMSSPTKIQNPDVLSMETDGEWIPKGCPGCPCSHRRAKEVKKASRIPKIVVGPMRSCTEPIRCWVSVVR